MLKNYVKYNKTDLQTIFGATSLFNIPEDFKSIGVSVDTRTIEKGNLFSAQKGETIDGHSKVFEALEKGAVAAVVERQWYGNTPEAENKPLILVKNSLQSFGKLANYHRKRFNIPIIAIGGSNGKTTTKEMVASVLSKKFKVLKTYRNFNNQIGVPVMLFMLSGEFEAAVIEIATNEPGEIAILSEILAPTHGIITNIGKEHLEKLIDLDGVEMEEAFLYGYLHKKDGTAFINLDDERLARYLSILDNRFTYGTKKNSDIEVEISLDNELYPEINYKLNKRISELDLSEFKNEDFKIKLSAQGIASALNSIPAITSGLYFGLTPVEIKRGIESYITEAGQGYGRMLFEKVNEISIINDCYNANPSSMALSLNTLNNIKSAGRKIAVLGDMLELGESSLNEHLQILKLAMESSDEVLITGNLMKIAYSQLIQKDIIRFFDEKTNLTDYLINIIKQGDKILVKGSRGMKMEEIINSFKEHFSKNKN